MTSTIYLLTLCLPLGTVLAVFGMRYLVRWKEAKTSSVHEAAWRRTVETCVATQAETAAALAGVSAALADIAARLGAVERVLRAVE